jgi:hypothetical protein
MKAFPTTAQTWDIHNGRDLSGMDLRDYFAAKAMTGGMWIDDTQGNTYERDARECYKIADAMMKARDEAA